MHIARGSRRTPSQVVKADVERNEHINQLQKAYTWAYSEKENYANKVKLATVASEKFDVTVVPQTLRKLIREDRSELLPSGPKRVLEQDEIDMIFAALNTWVAIGQINGDPEKKTDDLL